MSVGRILSTCGIYELRSIQSFAMKNQRHHKQIPASIENIIKETISMRKFILVFFLCKLLHVKTHFNSFTSIVITFGYKIHMFLNDLFLLTFNRSRF